VSEDFSYRKLNLTSSIDPESPARNQRSLLLTVTLAYAMTPDKSDVSILVEKSKNLTQQIQDQNNV
jgi:hypothetical protein